MCCFIYTRNSTVGACLLMQHLRGLSLFLDWSAFYVYFFLFFPINLELGVDLHSFAFQLLCILLSLHLVYLSPLTQYCLDSDQLSS